MLLSDGLWDQIRVDCGREFALILFVQELLSSYRTNVLRQPYLQTRSTQVCYSIAFFERYNPITNCKSYTGHTFPN